MPSAGFNRGVIADGLGGGQSKAMKFRKATASPLFAFWTFAALVTLVLLLLHPFNLQSWLIFAICFGGVVLYFPFAGTGRVRKTITLGRSVTDVYDFLSQPNNL